MTTAEPTITADEAERAKPYEPDLDLLDKQNDEGDLHVRQVANLIAWTRQQAAELERLRAQQQPCGAVHPTGYFTCTLKAHDGGQHVDEKAASRPMTWDAGPSELARLRGVVAEVRKHAHVADYHYDMSALRDDDGEHAHGLQEALAAILSAVGAVGER